jgi:serine/threonine protein kinase
MDRQTFLANMRRSGLVTDSELSRLLPRLPDSDRGKSVARHLVDLGVLTRFQAERLLAGRTAGFFPGPYRVLDQIGRGGMGRVYKAEHRTMGRLVALKVLAPQFCQTERARELFLREVRALARLVHPNIVTAFDAYESGGRFYLALELVDGPNLDQLVRGEGTLSVGRACEYARQVAHGLQCAFNAGMVHRDIKPANLLVQRRGLDGDADSPGLVKISDFGLARLQHPDAPADPSQPGTILAKANSVMGTPDYLSPEQGRDLHDADIRSDLYSLGCTFYFLLAGRVPFPGTTTIDKLIRHNTEPAPPLTRDRPDVPPAVAAVVAKLLAKAPEDRYQTPAELAQALAPYAATGSVHRVPPVAPSAASADTLPPPPAGTVGSGPEFDFTAEDCALPVAPSRSMPSRAIAVARWRTRGVAFLEGALGRLRQAFGK